MSNKRFKIINCPSCGQPMSPKYGDPGCYECETCCRYEAVLDNGTINFCDMDEYNNTEEIIGGYFDERPPECTGCGSDMYPDCRNSCSFFDD